MAIDSMVSWVEFRHRMIRLIGSNKDSSLAASVLNDFLYCMVNRRLRYVVIVALKRFIPAGSCVNQMLTQVKLS